MIRNCPRCSYPMEALSDGAVTLDHCRRCGGSFYDPGEAGRTLGRLAEPASWMSSGIAAQQGPTRLPCPARHGPLDGYLLRFDAHQVEVDVCPQCKGLWLDAGEAPQLARLVSAEAQLRQAAESSAGGVRSYLFQLFTGFPREVYNPVRRRPDLLRGLVAMLVAVFVLQQLAGPLALQFTLVPAALFAGQQVWGLLTHALLHGGLWHLVGNLYFLYVFGDNVEDRLGKAGLGAVLLSSALAGGLAHAAMNASSAIPTLGASGAVAGVMGAYLVLFPGVKLWVVFLFVRFKIPVLLYLGFWVGLQALNAALDVPGIAWYAHLGGFAAGIAMALAWRHSGGGTDARGG